MAINRKSYGANRRMSVPKNLNGLERLDAKAQVQRLKLFGNFKPEAVP